MTYPSAAAAGATPGSESLDKMLQAIAVESTEAEAFLFLANYHREHADLDAAGVYVNMH